MKKVLSVTLAAVLLFTAFVTVFSFNAAAESVELLGNGNFNGTAGERVPWQQVDNSAEKNAAFVYAEEAGRQFASGKAGSAVFKQVTLKANVSYTVSFEARFLGETVPDSFNSFYRAGFAAKVSALGNSNFVGPNSTGNKYFSIYGSQLKKVKDGIIANVSAWAAHSFTFTPAADLTTYFVLGSYDSSCKATLEVDNAFICKTEDLVTVTAKAGQGGSVSGGKKVVAGNAVTVRAAAQNGYRFTGWFENGVKKSNQESYTFTVTNNITLTAKFESDGTTAENLLQNGDFESGLKVEKIFDNADKANAQTVMKNNAGKWGRLFSGVTVMDLVGEADFTEGDSTTQNGTAYLKTGTTADGKYIRGFGQFVYLEKGDYVLQFTAKNNSNYLKFGVWSSGSLIQYEKDITVFCNPVPQSQSWVAHSVKFTAANSGYYQIGFGGNAQGAPGAVLCLDNIALYSAQSFVTVTAKAGQGGSVSGPLNLVKAGDSVTIKAVPDENYSFVGWFLNGALVTAEPSYTFTVTSSAEYVAKFNLNLAPDEIIQNGDFEYNSGSLLGWETVKLNDEGVTLVTDSDTGSHAAKVSDGGILAQRASFKKGEKYVISFDAKFTDFSIIPEAYQSFYRSGLTTDLNSLNNSSFIGPGSTGNKYVSIFGKNKAADNNWHTYTYSYDSLNDLDCWLVFGCVSNLAKSGILFDNIVVYNAKSANELQLFAVSAGGSGTVSSNLTGYLKSGTVVQLTAEANKGSVFGGWYQNGKLLSTANPFTYTCNSSEAVYAKFFNAKTNKESMQAVANSNFEDGFTGWNFKNIEGLKNSSTLQKDGSTNYVRLGRSDMLSQTVELQNGYTYRVSVVSRADPKNVTLSGQYGNLRFAVAKPGTGTTKFADALDEGEPDSVFGSSAHTQRALFDSSITDVNKKRESLRKFNTYTYDIGNYTGKTMLADIVVGIPYYMFPGDLEVASITIARFSLGISNYEPVNLYGEDFYNNVANAGFSNNTDNADWGSSLPAGWQIKKEKGNNYLSVQSNTKTYGFSVYPGAVHLVSLSMRTKSAGNSRVEIVDAAGNVLGDCIQTDPRKAVLQPKTNNSWQRVGMEIYIPFNVDRIYLRIIGANNVLDLDDVTVVRNRNATLKNMNVASMANYNYNTAKYYNPTLYYTADGANTAEGENAATGEGAYPVIPLAATVVTTALLLLVLKPKKNKGEVK